MARVSYSQLRDNLASYLEEVCASRAPLLVIRQNAGSVVITMMNSMRNSVP